MKLLRVSLILLFINTLLFAQSITEQKAKIEAENSKTLQMLYKAYPSAKKTLQSAYGYATFNNVGLNLLFVSVEGGSGVAINNHTNKRIYMKMASGGVGVGFGLKDFRAIFIFENQKVFDSFIDSGWEANAQADVAVKAEDKGGSVEAAVTVQPGIKLYKLTKNGVALQATIQGTKYWKDSELN